MRSFNILPLMGLFVFFISAVFSGPDFVFAQAVGDHDNEEIPPWMEKVDRGGGSTYLVPKGAKIKEVTSGFVKVEPPAEYVARQIYEMDKRQAAMEKALKDIKSGLEELRAQCALQQQNPDEKAP